MFPRKNLSLLILLFFLIAATAGLFQASFFQNFFSSGIEKRIMQNEFILSMPKLLINVEVILDVSGSMWEQIEGVNKIINSKDIIQVLINDFPEDVRMGLRTFGGNKVSHLEIPLGTQNRKEMEKALKKLRPSGKSPIGFALDLAGKDFASREGKKYIILISDGLNNGNIDPIFKAEELRKNGIIIHVVYLKSINGNGDKVLSQIAKVGGGHFYCIEEKDLVVPTMILHN